MSDMERAQELVEKKEFEKAFNLSISYAYRIVTKFYVKGMERDDIKNEALLSLWKAIKTYDKEKGTKLKTYIGRVIAMDMMNNIKYWDRKKRDGVEVDFDSFSETLSPKEREDLRDLKIDLRYFFPQFLPTHLRDFFNLYLELGNFLDCGKRLGLTITQTYNYKENILEKLRIFLKNDYHNGYL